MKSTLRIILTGTMVLTSIIGLSAPKSDIVVLVNGNAVTGEIKSLEFGSLQYSTDSMGTVSIDWEDITSLTSNQYIELEVSSGSKFYGNLELAEALQSIAIGFGDDTDLIKMNEIVRIIPIATNERILNRLEGSTSFGYNTDKASGVTQGRVAATVTYRTAKHLMALNLDASVTSQDEATNTERHTIAFNYQRFRGNRWFSDWSLSEEGNDEQGIASRFSLGGGLGRYLVQTNKNQFSLTLGLVATTESFTGSDPDTTNAEGKITVRYLHRSIVPESDVTFSTLIFPLLEDLSSYRAETNLTFRREIVSDFFFDLSIYHSYLSDPPEGSEQVDYGVVTSLGYKF
jgi:hypothetical protein